VRDLPQLRDVFLPAFTDGTGLLAALRTARTAARLESLLASARGSGVTVESWFTRAGATATNDGARQIAALLARARGQGGDATWIEAILNRVAGDAAVMTRMTTAAHRFTLGRPAPVTQPSRLAPELRAADTVHFFERHTGEFLGWWDPRNFRAPTTTLWPKGTAEATLLGWVDEGIVSLRASGVLPPTAWLARDVPTSGGLARIGINPATNPDLTQFYPKAPGLWTFTRQEMKAFRQLFTGVAP